MPTLAGGDHSSDESDNEDQMRQVSTLAEDAGTQERSQDDLQNREESEE
jgi:hypothetical protein